MHAWKSVLLIVALALLGPRDVSAHPLRKVTTPIKNRLNKISQTVKRGLPWNLFSKQHRINGHLDRVAKALEEGDTATARASLDNAQALFLEMKKGPSKTFQRLLEQYQIAVGQTAGMSGNQKR